MTGHAVTYVAPNSILERPGRGGGLEGNWELGSEALPGLCGYGKTNPGPGLGFPARSTHLEGTGGNLFVWKTRDSKRSTVFSFPCPDCSSKKNLLNPLCLRSLPL
uniref:Macaca fascicularis brain cDNA clone: QtrA-11447, similar to human methionine aminopeptidase 1D (MAP1D), mRNA, RefSeq: NM_199227.1 n=1 Tax=Macaca fascicularis TaxID=9541 RepID=I7GHU6_MACFA|nr:unnamed protein product [Macaca fascicularis]